MPDDDFPATVFLSREAATGEIGPGNTTGQHIELEEIETGRDGASVLRDGYTKLFASYRIAGSETVLATSNTSTVTAWLSIATVPVLDPVNPRAASSATTVKGPAGTSATS